MKAKLPAATIHRPAFLHQLLMMVLTYFSLPALHASEIQIYVDDKKDFAVYLKREQPGNIATHTALLVFDAINIKPTFYLSSAQRALTIMRNTNNAVCVTNKIKTPAREKEFLLSQPINLYLSRILYQHQEQAPLSASVLNDKGALINLTKLFEVYSDKIIVISETLSYGGFLDKQIATINARNKHMLDGSNPYDRAYRMFSLQRSDFTIAYPAEIYRHHRIDNKVYRSYRIAGAPKYVQGHFMCNKTPESKAFIEAVNNSLNELYYKKEFALAHTQWLAQSEHALTLAYIKEFINNLALDHASEQRHDKAGAVNNWSGSEVAARVL